MILQKSVSSFCRNALRSAGVLSNVCAHMHARMQPRRANAKAATQRATLAVLALARVRAWREGLLGMPCLILLAVRAADERRDRGGREAWVGD